MPSRSQLSGRESRSARDRSNDQSSKDCKKQRSVSSGKTRSSAPKSHSPSESHGKGTASSFSAGFRIASTAPHSGKVARKESVSHSSHAQTPSKGEKIERSGTGSSCRCGTPSCKQTVQTPAQPAKKPMKRRSPGTPTVIYKDFGSSSQRMESALDSLPDPFLELTNMANQEFRQAELAARTKLAMAALNGATKGTVSSPSPRPASSANGQGGACRDPPSCGSSTSKVSTTAETVTKCTSPVASSARGSSRSGSRAGTQRPASARQAAASNSEKGDGCSGGVGGRADGDAPSHSTHRRRPSSSARDVNNKHARSRYTTIPEQEDDEDEEDETGIPQAVRLPETTTDEPETSQDIFKRLHKDQMESIARSVKPSNLMKHLSDNGYFRYDYSGSARTTMDNHNLKSGMKKGVERLYLWLSMYSPPDSGISTPKG